MNYTDYIYFSDYVRDLFEERKKKNPSYSVRAFAKFLGYRNPTLMNDILRKKRKPTVEMALKLSHKLFYAKHQTEYLVKIAEYERAKNFEERDLIITGLRKLLAQREWKIIDLKQYDLMNQPHVLLIYTMMGLKDFKPTISYLNRRLRFKITQTQLDQAFKTLMNANYIQPTNKGDYEYCKANTVIAAGDVGVKSQLNNKFHRNMLKVVQDIFVDLPSDQRDVRSTTIGIRKQDFELIRDEIKIAHQKVIDYAINENMDDVYILTTQLVPATQAME